MIVKRLILKSILNVFFQDSATKIIRAKTMPHVSKISMILNVFVDPDSLTLLVRKQVSSFLLALH